MKCSFLTQRIEELWSLPSPQGAIFMRDHIRRFMLVEFYVERHFIQETVHLQERELKKHSQSDRSS